MTGPALLNNRSPAGRKAFTVGSRPIHKLTHSTRLLAPTEYLNRHDRAAQYIHWVIFKNLDLHHDENWWEHKPPPVLENDHIALLWNFTIQTDRKIDANRPDIILKDFRQKSCLLIDMTVAIDINVSAKTYQKLSKYKDLEIEISKMWNLKTKTIPIVIGTLGMTAKRADYYLAQIPGNPKMAEVQKIVLMGTAHVLRKVLCM
uniref:Uncharacterized protein n=1 Tax=Octopus bimaculoides TaxID=37653 RepID=A0A0L8FXY1_OCTBM